MKKIHLMWKSIYESASQAAKEAGCLCGADDSPEHGELIIHQAGLSAHWDCFTGGRDHSGGRRDQRGRAESDPGSSGCGDSGGDSADR